MLREQIDQGLIPAGAVSPLGGKSGVNSTFLLSLGSSQQGVRLQLDPLIGNSESEPGGTRVPS